MNWLESSTRVVARFTLAFVLAAAGQVVTRDASASTERDLGWVPKGAICVRHGRNMLGPPVGSVISFGQLEDIPHTGMYLGANRAYDLRIVNEKMRQRFGLNQADYPNGLSVIFQTILDDKTPEYTFDGRFKNVGWFSVVDSRIDIMYRGELTKFRDLPPEVKGAIVEKVCENAEREVGPIERTADGGRQAKHGKRYGQYSFMRANCFHPILRMYDEALKELGITVVLRRPDDGKSRLGPGEERYVAYESKPIPGTNLSTAPKTLILKKTTLTELFTVFGIADPS